MTVEQSYEDEREFLNSLYDAYSLEEAPQTQAIRKLIAKTFSPYIKGGIALELGCSDGFMTELLARSVDKLDVIDASENFIGEAKKRALPNVDFHCSLFEEFQSDTRYDYVFASFVLEHVLDVAPVLSIVRQHLKPDGRFFAVVPNARALSRQLALHMGLIGELTALTENDLKFGHRRVYDRVHFNRDLEAAGFNQIAQGGIMLKILADFQMDELISTEFLKDEHIDGLYSLGLEYPDLCGALFSVCEIR